MRARGCEKRSPEQRSRGETISCMQAWLFKHSLSRRFHSWSQWWKVKTASAGLGQIRASISLRSINISPKKEGAIGTFWRGRINWVKAQGNLLSAALRGTWAVQSRVRSPDRGRYYGPNGRGSGGGKVGDERQTSFPIWKLLPSCSSPPYSLLHLQQQSTWHISYQYFFSKSM